MGGIGGVMIKELILQLPVSVLLQRSREWEKYNAMFNVSNALNALKTLTLTNKHVKIDSEVRLCCQREKH